MHRQQTLRIEDTACDRKVPSDLAAILSRVESRRVADDYTLRLDGQTYQIPREHVPPGLRGQRVAVKRP